MPYINHRKGKCWPVIGYPQLIEKYTQYFYSTLVAYQVFSYTVTLDCHNIALKCVLPSVLNRWENECQIKKLEAQYGMLTYISGTEGLLLFNIRWKKCVL